jgi:uncharacterized lipoprotein YbaY
MSKLRILITLVALALPLTALPAAAQDADMTPMVVSGTISLPDGSALPAGTVVNVAVQDTSLADAAAVRISSLAMEASGATSPIPFALSVLPGTIEALESARPFDITLRVRIDSADGELLFINDTMTPAFGEAGPLTDIVVELIAV